MIIVRVCHIVTQHAPRNVAVDQSVTSSVTTCT